MIVILESKIKPAQLKQLCDLYFNSFVKFVADVQTGIIAIGGELHSDAEERLLNRGSSQHDLWGANFYPFKPRGERLEFTALINIRPRDNNTQMEIENTAIQKRLRNLAENLILAPDESLA